MMMTEIYLGNAIWIEQQVTKQYWLVKNSDGGDPVTYPVDVLDVNGSVIGTASDKQDYMDQWNANTTNTNALGYLQGEEFPFVFSLSKKRPPVDTGPTTTITVRWGWFNSDPYTGLLSSDTLTYQKSGTFTHNASLSLDISAASSGKYFVIKVPTGETVKTSWFNTGFNSGTIPDSVFRDKFTTAGYDYYVTRVPATFSNTQPLNLS